MCPSSVWRPSTGYDSFDKFADHSTMNRQPYWFMPLLCPGSTIAICWWPEHQSLLPTSWSRSWTLQRELCAARRSTTVAWHTCFTLSYIGSMWQIESSTSLRWRCTSACMARHQIICQSCVHRSLKLLSDSIFVPPAAIYTLFHGFSSIHTAVAPSLLLDQWHGTCSKTICMSQTCKLTVFVVHWSHFFFNSTRYIEHIRDVIFCDDALHKFTFTLQGRKLKGFMFITLTTLPVRWIHLMKDIASIWRSIWMHFPEYFSRNSPSQ